MKTLFYNPDTENIENKDLIAWIRTAAADCLTVNEVVLVMLWMLSASYIVTGSALLRNPPPPH